MKRKLILSISCLLLMMLCACTQVTNPLLRSEATPLPGSDQQLHSAAADGSTQQTVTLFFRFLDYPLLAGESRVITIRQDESFEHALIRALLEGPSASQIELKRLIGEDVIVEDISVSGDMLFLTLNDRFLRDGIPDSWNADPDWAEEAPARRMLALQSIVATITENLPYSSVQVLISSPGESSARLDRSYFLTGEMGPADPLMRNDSLLLTPATVVDQFLNAWFYRDFHLMYDLTASYGHQRPVYSEYALAVDQAPALCEGYSHSAASVSQDGQTATVTLEISYLKDEMTVPLAGYPLRIVRDNGLWKISYESLLHLLIR